MLAYDYSPYGEIIPNQLVGIRDQKYLFTGKENDTESEYDYFGARYYNSKLGIWLQVDPLAEKYAGWSPYNYTLANPLRFIDPDGNKNWDQVVKGGHFTSGFGKRGTGNHRGIDVAASLGNEIYSFASGKVVKVANNASWGNYVVIQHSENYFSLYAHMDSKDDIMVQKGQIVNDDFSAIANVGNNGTRSTGPHLHLEVGQANSLSEFLSIHNRDVTRSDPRKIGDLEKHINNIFSKAPYVGKLNGIIVSDKKIDNEVEPLGFDFPKF